MDAGEVVRHGTFDFRRRPGTNVYEYRDHVSRRRWREADFSYTDIHATDWRVVSDASVDAPKADTRLCVGALADALEGLAVYVQRNPNISYEETMAFLTSEGAQTLADTIAKMCPELFREDTP